MLKRSVEAFLGGALLLLCLGLILSGQTELDAAIEAFFAADTPSAIDEAIDRLIDSGAGCEEMAARLRRGRTYSAIEPGWRILERICSDGVSRLYHVFVPRSYDPSLPMPVLFSLHGAVNQRPYTVEEFLPKRAMWEEPAEENGFIVVMPHGDREATWWSEAGRQNILAQLTHVKQFCNVDENRVFLAGFSAGGHGTYWMAFHDPTPWAGFIPLYGSVAGPSLGPYPCYPRNLINRPILAANGLYDEVLPLGQESSLIAQLRMQGVGFEWEIYPTTHNLFLMVPYEWPRTTVFLTEWERDPYRPQVLWETSQPETGRCDWVRIDEIAERRGGAGFEDINLQWIEDAKRLAASIAYEASSGRFVVVGVEPDGLAHRIGVKVGDEIVAIDGQAARTDQEVAAVMKRKIPGEPIEIEVLRDGTSVTLLGLVTTPETVYRRDLLTGSIYVSVKGNEIAVTTRNVARYTLFLSSDQFDLSSPIRVITNGKESFCGEVAPDTEFMLRQAALDHDRRAVYEAKIEIVLPGR